MQSIIPTESLLCPQCGYDLRAIDSERCPECGSAIDRDALRQSQIPWEHRRQIGWWRAYRRTVALVLLHPKKLAAEIARPVRYRDAQLFRWVTVLMAMAPVLVCLILWWRSLEALEWQYLYFRGTLIRNTPDQLFDSWGLPALIGGLLAAVVALTGVQSYFFHPRQLPVPYQNHALALSYYSCGLLVPCAVLASCAWASYAVAEKLSWGLYNQRGLLTFVEWVTLGGAGFCLMAYLVRTLGLLCRLPHCGWFRLPMATLTMIAAPALAAAIVFYLPLLIYRIVPIVH